MSKQENLIKLAIRELCTGRTFYEDYFKEVDWETLSRVDRALFILSVANNDSTLGTPTNLPTNIMNQIKKEK